MKIMFNDFEAEWRGEDVKVSYRLPGEDNWVSADIKIPREPREAVASVISKIILALDIVKKDLE